MKSRGLYRRATPEELRAAGRPAEAPRPAVKKAAKKAAKKGKR